MKLTAIFLAMLCAACSPQPQAEATPAAETETGVHPISGLEVIPVTVTSGETSHRFKAELAETPEAQGRGLMFRTELPDDEAMIFPSNPPAPRGFWMKNVPIPLDIIFVGTDNRILNIAAMTTPYSEESVLSAGMTNAVLELRGGLAAELGIKPGDLVEW